MTVARFGDPVEASLAKNYREEAGFKAFLIDPETVSGRAGRVVIRPNRHEAGERPGDSPWTPPREV